MTDRAKWPWIFLGPDSLNPIQGRPTGILYVQLFYITLTSARETCEIHRQCVQAPHPHNLSLDFTRAWHHHSAVHQETSSEDVVPFRGYAPLPWSDMVGSDPHLLPINHWFWLSCGPKLFELRALKKNAGSRGEMMITHGISMDLRSIPQTYPRLKCKEKASRAMHARYCDV